VMRRCRDAAPRAPRQPSGDGGGRRQLRRLLSERPRVGGSEGVMVVVKGCDTVVVVVGGDGEGGRVASD